MNEAETRAEHIDPALRRRAGASSGQPHPARVSHHPGRIEGRGRRGKPLTADYVLEYRNTSWP
jgi:type I restriction enzyme R subunit